MKKKIKYPHKAKFPWMRKPTKAKPYLKSVGIPTAMKRTYNIFQTDKRMEMFHPQFIAVDRDAISGIESKGGLVEISTKPSRVKVSLFKGDLPLTHVNIVRAEKQRTLGRVI